MGMKLSTLLGASDFRGISVSDRWDHFVYIGFVSAAPQQLAKPIQSCGGKNFTKYTNINTENYEFISTGSSSEMKTNTIPTVLRGKLLVELLLLQPCALTG